MSSPFGLTVPANVAELAVMEMVEPVVTIGACPEEVTVTVVLFSEGEALPFSAITFAVYCPY